MKMTRPQLYPLGELPESFESVPGMQNIDPWTTFSFTSLKELEYEAESGERLELLVIQPPVSDALLPCIFFVQGSAWRRQKLFKNIPHLIEFSKRGYVIVIPRYRSSDIAVFPGQIRDIRTAVSFFSARAKEFCADPARIFLWGDSSGAHTVLMTAFTCTDPAFGPVCPPFQGVVDYYGPVNLIEMGHSPSTMDHWSPDSPEGLLFGHVCVPEHPEFSEAADPSRYLNSGAEIPPVLILHGSRDQLVPFRQSILLYEALKRAGKETAFYRLAGSGHGGEEFWSPPVLDIVDTFIQRHLKKT